MCFSPFRSFSVSIIPFVWPDGHCATGGPASNRLLSSATSKLTPQYGSVLGGQVIAIKIVLLGCCDLEVIGRWTCSVPKPLEIRLQHRMCKRRPPWGLASHLGQDAMTTQKR